MERLLFVADIAERYRCSAPTARAYIRQMEHMEKPLAVRESAVAMWEQERTRYPQMRKPKPYRIARITEDWHRPRRAK